MAVQRKYRINLKNYGNPPAIMLSQYDENYQLTFEVYDGALPVSSLAAYSVKLVGTRADTLAYSFDGTVSGTLNNTLKFTIDTTMTACAGKGVAEIVILDTSNDIKFASFNLPVFVEKAAVPDDAIDADVERAQEIAEEVQELIDNAQELVAHDVTVLKSDLDATKELVGLVIPYNIFDRSHTETGYTDGWAVGYTINTATGALESNSNPIAVTYMMQTCGKHKIVLKYGSGQIVGTIRHAAAYDKSGAFISTSELNVTEWELPSNAYYVRIEHTYGSTVEDTSRLTNSITVCDDSTAGTAYKQYVPPYVASDNDEYNSYDILDRFAIYADRTHGGVAYTWDKETKTCAAVGTASGTSATNLYYDAEHLPDAIKAGKSYFVHVHTTDENLLLEFTVYKSAGSTTKFLVTDTTVSIPSDAVGLLLRVRTRNDMTVDATITVDIRNAKSNAELTKDVEALARIKNYIQIFPKVTTIGDSLMGGFMNRDGVSVNTETARAAGNNWVNYLALRIGRTFTNLATGGSTAKQWREELLTGANIDTDAYIIGIGINDYRNSLAVGTSADIASDKDNNADSFYGNYDYMVRQLTEWKPDAHVFCFTMPSIGGGAATGYNAAVKYICGLYPEKVHCINLRDDYDEYFNADVVVENYAGKHFNPIAYNYMSSIIEMAINDYMEDNNELFATAPYA